MNGFVGQDQSKTEYMSYTCPFKLNYYWKNKIEMFLLSIILFSAFKDLVSTKKYNYCFVAKVYYNILFYLK